MQKSRSSSPCKPQGIYHIDVHSIVFVKLSECTSHITKRVFAVDVRFWFSLLIFGINLIFSIDAKNSQKKIITLRYEPRDTWCLGGGLTPGIGWFWHTKGVYRRFISWFSERRKFWITVKNKAIVDARWVRIYVFPTHFATSGLGLLHIHTWRGDSTIACSTVMVSYDPENGMSMVWLPVFRNYQSTPHLPPGVSGCDSDWLSWKKWKCKALTRWWAMWRRLPQCFHNALRNV